ncbi:NAD-dependent epimerase/dehydratase family protein [Falsiroseomonas selenitidurans]|uniref:NAD(P)-dependent oxidoreductase n=1 Tax=Falsiroseomonas selenitidurans TaxID=2716335 RepID=A0ABX1EHK8_9PROT|nr:NAD(P)-dependent oxidoreductase [Falsiroseomonas selenitidurans]NKC34345.1 NAD(P)-dependent oxidoreductase [Falsiroseomonas selenitidurans]
MSGGTPPVLLTGAAGRLGRVLAPRLAAAEVALRLTDRRPFPDALPPGASFTPAELEDAAAVAALAEGCRAILHFGAVATEAPGFEAILAANLRGALHVFEAARAAGARVVHASSAHVAGFHDRPAPGGPKLPAGCDYRPDSVYGLSKLYGEQLGRLYWDKHGVESVHLRIGWCAPEPRDALSLSIWLSPDDLARLCLAALSAQRTGWAVVWGASANPASFWDRDDRALIGWHPRDSAEPWRDRVGGVESGDPLAERFQGGRSVMAPGGTDS